MWLVKVFQSCPIEEALRVVQQHGFTVDQILCGLLLMDSQAHNEIVRLLMKIRPEQFTAEKIMRLSVITSNNDMFFWARVYVKRIDMYESYTDLARNSRNYVLFGYLKRLGTKMKNPLACSV